MIVVVSPAKTLDFESKVDCPEITSPLFLETTWTLMQEAKKLNEQEIAKLMKLGPKLSKLNFERFQSFEKNPQKKIRPCAFAFKGDTYKGLHFESLQKSEQDYAQENLRILSGLYGLLRPY